MFVRLGASGKLRARNERVRNDRGEGPVSYMAVVLLIALIAGAIVATGVHTYIADGIKNAVGQVWEKGTKEAEKKKE